MDPTEPLDQRQMENAQLRAKLVQEIQDFSRSLKAVQLDDVALRRVIVKSYQEMIDAREQLLRLIPSTDFESRRSA